MPLPLLAALVSACGRAPNDMESGAQETGRDPATAAWVSAGVDSAVEEKASPPRRVLLVVVDDMSAMSSSMYAEDFPDVHFRSAPMPNVEGICESGVRFRQAWSAPICAASRATMFTGRHGFRNGGTELLGNDSDHLPVDEPTLPRLLAQANPSIKSASFGKYNLGHTDDNGGDRAPNEMGWSHFAGALDASVPNYFSWSRTVDGVTDTSTTYATTQTVDDTIAWLAEQGPDQPWMVWLAFNAPHAPFHAPPSELHDYNLRDGSAPPTGPLDPDVVLPYYLAASQAMDTELGRLLQWMRDNGQGDTDILFIADNGSPLEVIESPMDPARGKSTVFEGGIHVPFCVSGPSVAQGGRVDDRPVGAVDILATVLDLQGAPAPEELNDAVFDGQSIAPILRDPQAQLGRDWAFSEGPASPGYSPYGAARALTQGGDKLIRFTDLGEESLYDLTSDPFEFADRLADAESDGDHDDDHDDEDDQDRQQGRQGPEAEEDREDDSSQINDAVLRGQALGDLIDTLTTQPG